MTFSKLQLESLKLSSRASERLEWLVEELQASDDPRGFYCEFEGQGYKPWKPQEVAELLHHGLVTLHDESDYVPEWEEFLNDYVDLEDCDGVAFLKVNTETLLKYS